MTTRWKSTAYFVSLEHAVRHYRPLYDDDAGAHRFVSHKVLNKEIHIGKPPLHIGEILHIIDGGARYAIESAA